MKAGGVLGMNLRSLALSHGYFIRKANLFGPITHNLHNLSDVGTFTFSGAGMKDILVKAMAGTLLGSCLTLRKHRTVIKIFEKAG